VETIVSTLSNTLHHPKTIVERPSSIVSSSRSNRTGQFSPTELGSDKKQLHVSKATGLPVGMMLTTCEDGGSLRVALRQVPIMETPEDEENEEDDYDEEDKEEGEADGDAEEGALASRALVGASRKGETPEEKKIRKALVKAERRLKRESKSLLKAAFKEEEKKQVAELGRRDVLAGGIPLGAF
jgi:hypothetical protein